MRNSHLLESSMLYRTQWPRSMGISSLALLNATTTTAGMLGAVRVGAASTGSHHTCSESRQRCKLRR